MSERLRSDDRSRSALTACLFAAAPTDQLCWTVLVVDPALYETPGHVRLVGHYETEIAAIGAADQLADALNACLVPGEARLTATAFAIEPAAGHGSGADAADGTEHQMRAEPMPPTTAVHDPARRGSVTIT